MSEGINDSVSVVALCFFFFFQAEDGIRDLTVTGVQTCALPISLLFDMGALGVEVQDRELVLMPGTPALPEGAARCIAHFEERTAAEEAAQALDRKSVV